jgi:hypothetical protein
VIAKRAGADHDVDAFALVVCGRAWFRRCRWPRCPFAFEGGRRRFPRGSRNASWIAWACVAFMAWGATLFAYARQWNRLLSLYPTR